MEVNSPKFSFSPVPPFDPRVARAPSSALPTLVAISLVTKLCRQAMSVSRANYIVTNHIDGIIVVKLAKIPFIYSAIIEETPLSR